MELRKGYKQTEVGVIPEDWDVKKFTDCATLKHGFQFREQHFSNDGIKVVKIGTLKYSGELDFNNVTYVPYADLEKFRNFLLSEGDILMALTGATLGKCSIVETKEHLLQNYRVGNFYNKAICTKEYVYIILQSDFIQKTFKKLVNEAAQPNIGKGDFDKFSIPLPPTKAEQTAIATTLSDMDNLINSLSTLIEKKKAIKQGAMQQLLKPKEGWVECTLGDILELVADYTANGSFESLKNNVRYYSELNYAVLVRTTDLDKIEFTPERFTDKIGYEYLSKTSLYGGEIVIANVGSLGKVFRVPKFQMPMTLAPNTYLLKFKKSIVEDFIFQWLNTNEFFQKLMSKIGSTTLQAINKDNLRSIELTIPDNTDEQSQIAKILIDMDKEIKAIEQNLSKFQMLKQGMMQELLTGKTRLI